MSPHPRTPLRRRASRVAAVVAFGLIAPSCSDDARLLELSDVTVSTTVPQPSATGSVTSAPTSDGDPRPTSPASSTTARPGASTTGVSGVDGSSSSTVAPAATTQPAPVAPPGGGVTTTVLAGPAPDTWALGYTGGTFTPAAGEPVRIGFVNQSNFFPESTEGLLAAVAFLNAELGGMAGRPLEIVRCEVVTVADGGRCGQRLAGDPTILAVMTGTLLFGNRDLFAALDGTKPVLIGNGITTDDFTTTAGLTYSLGSVNVVPALPRFALDYLAPTPRRAALLYSEGAARRGAVDFLVRPPLEEAGIETTLVPVPDGATGAEVADSMRLAGVDTADLVISVVAVPGCIALYDALQLLAAQPAVVTTGLCHAPQMTAHLATLGITDPVPDGWYFAGNGYNVFAPDERSGMQTYVTKFVQYGPGSPAADPTVTTTSSPPTSIGSVSIAAPDATGYGAPVFANVLTLAKLANRLGSPGLTPAAVDEAMRAFRGPMMLQAGGLDCGVAPYIAVCAHFAGVQRYRAGRWIAIADGTNGRAIDVRAA
jgi:branched-chain amino acid transport system substrate-binding protein